MSSTAFETTTQHPLSSSRSVAEHDLQRPQSPQSPLPAVARPASLPPPPRRARAPTMTHNSRSLVLPTPDILSSVAGGAHYAGAFSTHDKHVHPANVEKHKRSLSMTAGDPIVEETYRIVMQDLQELFSGRPTVAILERRLNRDAVFEDSWFKCRGYEECAARFLATPKICSSSERIAVRILSATLKPNRLVFSQTQEYTFRFFGSKKIISSFVLVDLDEDMKIVRMVDQWNGEDPPTRWGAALFRKLSAKVTPWFVHLPKYSTSPTTTTIHMA